jgi:hypothetical protein
VGERFLADALKVVHAKKVIKVRQRAAAFVNFKITGLGFDKLETLQNVGRPL